MKLVITVTYKQAGKKTGKATKVCVSKTGHKAVIDTILFSRCPFHGGVLYWCGIPNLHA